MTCSEIFAPGVGVLTWAMPLASVTPVVSIPLTVATKSRKANGVPVSLSVMLKDWP